MRRLLFPLCIAVLLASCALPRVPDLKPPDFADEIQKYRTSARSEPDPSARAAAHYRLAVLYSHHRNPSPDYPQALKELETFVSLDPQKGALDDVRNRLVLLRALERAGSENRKLLTENKEMLRENRELKNSVEQLTKEKRELKETLEKMERLDIMIEEKRKKQLR